jgi:hypothetical protein
MAEYEAKHYNAVFDAMRKTFCSTWYEGVDWKKWGTIWRKQIKDWFFDQNFLIAEMTAGLEEAAGKGQWPLGTSFFHRLHDVCLKNRAYTQPQIKKDDGLESLATIMKRRV